LATHVDGADAGELTLTDGCAGQTLAAGASCVITVEARPASAGGKSAILSVSAGATTLPVAVAAEAVPPGALVLSPAHQAYEPVLIGTSGATHVFTVQNSGGAP